MAEPSVPHRNAWQQFTAAYARLLDAWAARLEDGPFRTAARDENGEVRAVELDGHPFFVAALFQPERSALAGADHPLIQAFVAATVSV